MTEKQEIISITVHYGRGFEVAALFRDTLITGDGTGAQISRRRTVIKGGDTEKLAEIFAAFPQTRQTLEAIWADALAEEEGGGNV